MERCGLGLLEVLLNQKLVANTPQHVVAARGTGRLFSSLQERNGMCYYLDGVRGCAAVLHSFESAKAAVACHHRTLNL